MRTWDGMTNLKSIGAHPNATPWNLCFLCVWMKLGVCVCVSSSQGGGERSCFGNCTFAPGAKVNNDKSTMLTLLLPYFSCCPEAVISYTPCFPNVSNLFLRNRISSSFPALPGFLSPQIREPIMSAQGGKEGSFNVCTAPSAPVEQNTVSVVWS